MSTFWVSLDPQALVLLRLAAMLLFAFCFSRVTKLFKLPNVTGYILSGIVIGPYVSGIVSSGMADAMSFLTDIALALIAFGTGEFFEWSSLKQSSGGIVVITVLEALMASLVVTLTMTLIFHLSLPFSLLLGAIASATAPASTLMTIRQYNAKGHFVNTILQVVVLDDAVALIAFSVCAAVAQILGSHESVDVQSIVLPVLYNIAAIGLGGAAAFLLRVLMRHVLSAYNHLLMTVILLLGLSGLCAAVDISPLLSCMVFGTIHANISKENTVFKRVDRFSPPILTLFFVVSGMRLNVQSLTSAGIIGIAYFIVRIGGKYLGASLGAVLAKSTAEVKKYLGMALIPQAGVSIGLAVLGERILPHDMGTLLSTIILSSSVLYEMVGPAAAKLSMHLAGVIPTAGRTKTAQIGGFGDNGFSGCAPSVCTASAELGSHTPIRLSHLDDNQAPTEKQLDDKSPQNHNRPMHRTGIMKLWGQKWSCRKQNTDAGDLYTSCNDDSVWEDGLDEEENNNEDDRGGEADEIRMRVDSLFQFRRWHRK